MAEVDLEHADLALLSDVEGTRVQLRRLQAHVRTRHYEQATVGPFEGEDQPTVFRGQGRPRSFQLTVRYLADEHEDLAGLLDLFELAHDAADGRLLLRSNLGQYVGLNPIEAVVVSDVTETASAPAVVDVSFTAQTVAFSLEV